MTNDRLELLSTKVADRLDEVRIRLARPNALMSLSLLGLMTGILAGGVIVLFRLLIEGTQEFILPGNGAEKFEALSREARFALPVLAALLLAAMFRWFSRGTQVLGVAHVLERMDRNLVRIGPRVSLIQAGKLLQTAPRFPLSDGTWKRSACRPTCRRQRKC